MFLVTSKIFQLITFEKNLSMKKNVAIVTKNCPNFYSHRRFFFGKKIRKKQFVTFLLGETSCDRLFFCSHHGQASNVLN